MCKDLIIVMLKSQMALDLCARAILGSSISLPGDLRFPNFSDVTTKLSKHVRDQFPSGHPLLDSRVTNQVAPEAVF